MERAYEACFGGLLKEVVKVDLAHILTVLQQKDPIDI